MKAKTLLALIALSLALPTMARGQAAVLVVPSDTCVSAIGAKSAADSVILPAYTGLRHYITYISVVEYDTLAVTGSAAYNTVSTTNLHSMSWKVGNALALGATNTVLNQTFINPLRVDSAGVATKIKASAGGTGAYWAINVCYYKQR